jgi:GT2 family glycosyltransferase
MNDIAVIAIGRNEGERLRRCLASALASGCSVAYIDSKSTDGSPELARSMGAVVVELDMSLPFSAARARNAGFEQLGPVTRYIQFVDGDCEIVPGWIETARNQLESRNDVAVVCGRRRERFPEKSVYNQMADLEWNTPVGEAESCGGDSMMRCDVFRDVGGFDPSVSAGEEPELCQRIRAKGWKILRIDAEMTLHDAAMLSFGQWWKRMVRNGYGALDVATRFGSQGLYVRHARSTLLWAFGWPAFVLLGSIIAGFVLGPRWGAIMVVVLILTLPLQMLRVGLGIRKRAGSFSNAIAYGILTMLSKWADVAGQLSYRRDRRAGQITRLIEYKGNGGPVARTPGL